MEIHLKIKRSKKELEALENQEKEVRERQLNSLTVCRVPVIDGFVSVTAERQRESQVTWAEEKKAASPAAAATGSQ